MTDSDAVPMPSLAWHCRFTSLKVKEENVVHKVFTIAAAHLANNRAAREKQDGS